MNIDECVRCQRRTAISYDELLCADCAPGEIDGTVTDERHGGRVSKSTTKQRGREAAKAARHHPACTVFHGRPCTCGDRKQTTNGRTR